MLARGRRPSGIFACLAVVVKPIAAVPALTFLLRRQWTAVASGLATAVVVAVASILYHGSDDWLAYLRGEYVARSPAWLYIQSNTVSMLAELTRAFDIEGYPWESRAVMTLYYIIAVLVFGISVWIVSTRRGTDFWIAFCVLLLASLIIYPGTQKSYGIMLSIPLIVVVSESLRRNAGYMVPCFMVSASALLVNINALAAYVAMWAGFCLLLFRGGEFPYERKGH
jgi:hypothetical protein